MKKILNLAFTVVIILTAFVLQSCTDTSGSEKKNSEEAQRVLYVETEKVKSQEFTDYISLIGIAKAYQKAELSEPGNIWTDGFKHQCFHWRTTCQSPEARYCLFRRRLRRRRW